MKKLTALVLAFVMCIGLCACSQTGSVDKKLRGTWEDFNGTVYTFEAGRFTCEVSVFGLSLGTEEGDYEITERAIILYYDNGLDSTLEYTYEKGELTIEDLRKVN